MRNNSAGTKISEEGGRGVALGIEAKIHLQPLVRTMLRQAVPMQHVELNGGTDIHLQFVDYPMLQQVDAQRNL